jgi:hypothetical protein
LYALRQSIVSLGVIRTKTKNQNRKRRNRSAR